MLTENLESMQEELASTSKKNSKKVKHVEKFATSKLGKLDELISGQYLSEKDTKEYVEETLLNEVGKVYKKFNGLSTMHQTQIDELYFNHVAVPGLINHTIPTAMDFGTGNRSYSSFTGSAASPTMT